MAKEQYKIVITNVPSEHYEALSNLLIEEGFVSAMNKPDITRNAEYEEMKQYGVIVSIDNQVPPRLGFCWNNAGGINYYKREITSEWLDYRDLVTGGE